MSWFTELPRILRHMIEDLSATPTFSDIRLEETILVAAQLIRHEIDFAQTYTIDVDEHTLSPDPTLPTRDEAFINLTLLKAGCIIEGSRYRTELVGNKGGIRVRDGSSEVDLRGSLEGFQYLFKNGWCLEYEKAKFEFMSGNMVPGRIILGPFAGPNVYTGDSNTLQFY